MKTVLCCAALLAMAVAPNSALAANANNPYGNINHANDAGNDTGDSQVPALNQAQLDAARGAMQAPTGYGAPAPYGAYVSPPAYAYAYPPPAYYPAPIYVRPRPWRYYYGW
jgi:hypothetical protein